MSLDDNDEKNLSNSKNLLIDILINYDLTNI